MERNLLCLTINEGYRETRAIFLELLILDLVDGSVLVRHQVIDVDGAAARDGREDARAPRRELHAVDIVAEGRVPPGNRPLVLLIVESDETVGATSQEQSRNERRSVARENRTMVLLEEHHAAR